ncbi:MAG TPA: DoxX family protein [Bryobacteraceae bacterium]|nr:DoxX family protein [Bryobacteraceae bacterium]
MFAAYVCVAVLSSMLLAVVSALGKLRRNPYIVRSVHDVVGVPLQWFPFLAALEFAAAAGLLLGIKWAPLGIAAAAGMALYFVGAIVAHARANDVKGSGPALQMFCLAVTALITRTLSI